VRAASLDESSVDTIYMIPQTSTVTSEHMRFYLFGVSVYTSYSAMLSILGPILRNFSGCTISKVHV